MDQRQLRSILIDQFSRERTQLLPALHLVQHELGHLPDWALQVVSGHLRVPASEVYGAATSYPELRLLAPGRHLVRVCTGLSCWQDGGQELLKDLTDQLNPEPAETGGDDGVTVGEVPCGFLCPLAPAVEVDGRWVGRATAQVVVQQINRSHDE